MADLIDQRLEAQLDSKLDAKIANINKMLEVMMKQISLLHTSNIRSESENPGRETDGNSSSISSASLKRKRQKKKKTKKEWNARSSMAEEDPPVRRVSPSRTETPSASAENRPSGSETRVSPSAFSGSEKDRTPQGPGTSTDSSQSPSPSKGAMAASKKKYGRFEQGTPPPREGDPQRSQSPGPVASQAHSPARAKVPSQDPTLEGSEAQEATPSRFGVPMATLPKSATMVSRDHLLSIVSLGSRLPLPPNLRLCLR